ncbi:ACP-SH:acetate ligase [Rhodovastum atsumiense]|uniref:acyl carrier protein n=1 Tax=Rhodovastum atsumiense TaxID=504468 RepID=UPI00202486A7|nr:acyl carrier protein [Rhodovastum atsumiense]CAH2603686.1 ACP-SH:acetate ligase [Rhodovastum atsumiense]
MSDDALNALEQALMLFGNAPTLAEMPRRGLAEKGIAGPTAAHVIEEVHTPLNLAYVTFTTGSSAFQNIVGVTQEEIPDRCTVAREIFARLGVGQGARMLVTYPPLVNVFSAEALRQCGIEWGFLARSSRDALLVAACREQPRIILGESSFLRASLEQAATLGLAAHLPRSCLLVTAGTPLDEELLPVARRFGYAVHDLYGCQEFGWLTLDGRALREDIALVASPRGPAYRELVAGGLPTGDSFLVSESGHVCDREGGIITYRRERTYPEYEVVVTHTTATAAATVERAARSILRIKGRVVKVAPGLVTGAAATRLELVPGTPGAPPRAEPPIVIEGPVATRLFDALLRAQMAFQSHAKTDPAWTKRR